MSANQVVKLLIKAGLTHTSDGLLFDFCSREKFWAAKESCEESIRRRESELAFLKELTPRLEFIHLNGYDREFGQIRDPDVAPATVLTSAQDKSAAKTEAREEDSGDEIYPC